MRYILIFWAAPLGFFWSWYFLSFNDMNFGTVFLSRELHNLVFNIYGHILGLDPAAIPAMVAKACLLDTALIFGIFAFRKRRSIAAWWNGGSSQAVTEGADNAASLSSAP